MRKLTVCVVGLAFFLSGCGGSSNVEVVDLNKVLDILVKVLEEKDPTAAATSPKVTKTSAKPEGKAPTKKATAKKADSKEFKPVKEDKAKQEKILKRFADELNKAKLIKSTIGVSFATSGSIEGFTDKNKNMKRDSGDKKLFKIEIDTQKKRLIASDEHGYRRDHGYRRSGFSGGGFFMGYMFGSMMSRQGSHYSGSRRRPNYGSMKMSPKSYHSRAVSSVRSRTSGARSRSGSGGRSFGK